MCVFQIFNKKQVSNCSTEDYYNNLITNDNKNLYSFDERYLNQENQLLKMYGKADNYNKNIRLLVISDTHNCLDEAKFVEF